MGHDSINLTVPVEQSPFLLPTSSENHSHGHQRSRKKQKIFALEAETHLQIRTLQPGSFQKFLSYTRRHPVSRTAGKWQDKNCRKSGGGSLGVLETLPTHRLKKTGGLPSKKWGSDHLALVCELAFVNDIN